MFPVFGFFINNFMRHFLILGFIFLSCQTIAPIITHLYLDIVCFLKE